MPFPLILSSINILFCLGLTSFLLIRSDKKSFNFLLGILTLILLESGHLLIQLLPEGRGVAFCYQLIFTGLYLLPVSWSFFCLKYSQDSYKGLRALDRVIMVTMILIALLLIGVLWWKPWLIVILTDDATGQRYLIEGKLGYWANIYLLLGSIFVLSHVEKTIRMTRGTALWRIKFLLLGIGIIFGALILLSSYWILYSRLPDSFMLPHSVVLLLALGIMSFSLLRRSLEEEQIFISRQALYHSVVVLIAGGYLLGMGVLAELVNRMGIGFNFFWYSLLFLVGLACLATILLSEQFKQRLRHIINTTFYKRKYDYDQQWRRLTEKLSSRLTLDELLPPILETVVDTFGLNKASIWLYDQDRGELYLARGLNTNGDIPSFRLKEDLVREIQKQPFLKPELLYQHWDHDRLQIQRWQVLTGAVIIAPLSINDNLIGLLTLGRKLSGKGYDQEDQMMLSLIAKQVASNIFNVQLTERLAQARQLDIFYKTSSFILHDLKNSVSMLSLILDNAADNMADPEFQQEILQTIRQAVGRMKQLMNKLSRLPTTLELELRECNLNEIVERVLGRFRMNGTGEIHYEQRLKQLPSILADPLRIEQVITNLVLNATEALNQATGGREDKGIVIETMVEGEWICLKVQDNGPGINKQFLMNKLFKPFQTTKERGLGIGLYQCKTIIEAHRGKIEVESQEGQGTTFYVRLPKSD